MTIIITDHTVQDGDTVHIVYRLTNPDQFHMVACEDRDSREYARHIPKSEIGRLTFQITHGRSLNVCLRARMVGGFVQSDYIDIHVPYPLDVEAVRAIVREEIAADKAAETERRQQMLADIRAGKPVNAFVNYGDQPAPTKPTSVDDLIRVIKAELTRQNAQEGPSPYVDIISRDDDTAILDGEFDLRALATAILAGETPCA